MEIKNVMIAGAGTLGSQIAWQTAFHGFNVTVYDAFGKGLELGNIPICRVSFFNTLPSKSYSFRKSDADTGFKTSDTK